MNFKKFVILDTKEMQPMGDEKVNMLINTDHIISIKPIKIVRTEEIIEGYWIRTSNGKKYRAVQIPDEVRNMLEAQNDEPIKVITTKNQEDQVIQ